MYNLAQLYIGLGKDDNDILGDEVDDIVGTRKGLAAGSSEGEVVDKAMAKSIRRGIQQLVKQVRAAKQAGKPVVSLAKKPAQPGEAMIGGTADTEKWLRASAEAGNADAMVMLGNLLVTGQLSTLRPVRHSKYAPPIPFSSSKYGFPTKKTLLSLLVNKQVYMPPDYH